MSVRLTILIAIVVVLLGLIPFRAPHVQAQYRLEIVPSIQEGIIVILASDIPKDVDKGYSLVTESPQHIPCSESLDLVAWSLITNEVQDEITIYAGTYEAGSQVHIQYVGMWMVIWQPAPEIFVRGAI